MADITTLPIMTSEDAEKIGFARFNRVPTLPIDIPDGGFTISAKTSEGRRITFYFGPHRTGGPARFVDVQFHDAGWIVPNADNGRSPVFDVLTIGHKDRRDYDSRKSAMLEKPSILVVLMGQPGDDS